MTWRAELERDVNAPFWTLGSGAFVFESSAELGRFFGSAIVYSALGKDGSAAVSDALMPTKSDACFVRCTLSMRRVFLSERRQGGSGGSDANLMHSGWCQILFI